mgnify:CR=1 FL=1
MQTTPRGERIQIGIFGNRNAGKSSLINALAGQALAIVSEKPGTTTDPVSKAMELLPLGPVTLVDTAGLDDDEPGLGGVRVQRSLDELPKSDLVLAVLDATRIEADAPGLSDIFRRAQEHGIPLVVTINKIDRVFPNTESTDTRILSWVQEEMKGILPPGVPVIPLSAQTGTGIIQCKEALITAGRHLADETSMTEGVVPPGGMAILVMPIDSAAPKGRLILPQVQVMRDLLDRGALFAGAVPETLAGCLASLTRPPDCVITDSQAFEAVAAITPESVPLTSFSILFARYKGDLAAYVEGVRALETLRDGDRVLIAESCTHHVQCDDIGTVKIPRWLREKTGRKIEFDKCAGRDFPEDLSPWAAVIQCGGCMVTPREIRLRIARAKGQGVPVTNYGIMIAWRFGILERVLSPFAAELGQA